MNDKANQKEKAIHIALMLLYKLSLDVGLMPLYVRLYADAMAMHTETPTFLSYALSYLFFTAFMYLFFINKGEGAFRFVLIVIIDLCIIPTTSYYLFLTDPNCIIYPSIFWAITFMLLSRLSIKEPKELIRISGSENKLYILLFVCALCAVLIWSIAGFPVLIGFGESESQRFYLRDHPLPTVVNYIFMLLGGIVFPYLCAKLLSLRRYVLFLVCIAFGVLIYFVNGMKTWLVDYVILIAIFCICKVRWLSSQTNIEFAITIALIMLVVFSVIAYNVFATLTPLSFYGRIMIIPADIGFRSIEFFSNNELLYLRESILRYFDQSPYPGGSDFFMQYGASSDTHSSRANNGFWGDAFRNFGIAGLFVYPFLLSKTLQIVVNNGLHEDKFVQYYVLIIIIWGGVNTSFFTWLVTGGVIAMVLIEKICRIDNSPGS